MHESICRYYPAVAFAKAIEAGSETIGTAAFAGHVTLVDAAAPVWESAMS